MESAVDEQITEEIVMIEDERRGQRIRASVSYPAGPSVPRYLCVLASPHPHMGGTMDNKLVKTLACGLASEAVIVRFDYGASEDAAGEDLAERLSASMHAFWTTGNVPEDPAMIADADVVIQWARRLGDTPLVIIGYSFGAFVAGQMARVHHPAAVVYIAPTLARHDFAASSSLFIPKLVIFSDNDFATAVQTTETWISQLPPPISAICLPAADHFFRGRESEVLDLCRSFVNQSLSEMGLPGASR